jgi:hypothetical protein
VLRNTIFYALVKDEGWGRKRRRKKDGRLMKELNQSEEKFVLLIRSNMNPKQALKDFTNLCHEEQYSQHDKLTSSLPEREHAKP